MEEKSQYRLSKNQKNEIAQNLIDFLEKDTEMTDKTGEFIDKWIRSGPEGKRKAFFDVWEIVLKNYLPTTRPVLYRSCDRICKNGKIASFSGRFEFIRRFSKGKGSLIICDTEDNLKIDELRCAGQYRYSFYPIVEVLKKLKALGGCGFSEKILDDYIGEDEYIMRIDLNNMHSFKWIKND